jgi:hypothetical protein
LFISILVVTLVHIITVLQYICLCHYSLMQHYRLNYLFCLIAFFPVLQGEVDCSFYMKTGRYYLPNQGFSLLLTSPVFQTSLEASDILFFLPCFTAACMVLYAATTILTVQVCHLISSIIICTKVYFLCIDADSSRFVILLMAC